MLQDESFSRCIYFRGYLITIIKMKINVYSAKCIKYTVIFSVYTIVLIFSKNYDDYMKESAACKWIKNIECKMFLGWDETFQAWLLLRCYLGYYTILLT